MLTRLALVILALSICSVPITRGNDSITLNGEYKGKTSADKKRNPYLTTDSVTIDLKAGQRVELSVKVTGDPRKVCVALWNSDGDALVLSAPVTDVRGRPIRDKVSEPIVGENNHRVALSDGTARIVIGEVPATATYKITIYSDISGDYALTVKELQKKRDIDAIQKELKVAKQHVEELEKELKDMEKKK